MASITTLVDLSQLIEEVKIRPPLYNTTVAGYHDRGLKKRLWEEVCHELCDSSVWDEMTDDERIKVEKDIQIKWNSLRGCFRRDLNIKKRTVPGNGKRKKRKYIYFDSLLFLAPFTEAAKSDPDDIVNKEQKLKRRLPDSEVAENNYVDIDEDTNEDTQSDEDQQIKKRQKDENSQTRKKENLRMTKLQNIGQCQKTKIQKEDNQQTLKLQKEYNQHTPKIQKEEDHHRTKHEDNDNDDEAFFRSLFPYIRQFTQDQKLLLRIELIKTILNFKQSQNEMSRLIAVDPLNSPPDSQGSSFEDYDIVLKRDSSP